VVISDEEWDIKKLQNSKGSRTDAKSVVNLLHGAGYKVHAVIVRPNRDEDLNEEEILSLTEDEKRYHKVYTDSFETEIKAAFASILEQL